MRAMGVCALWGCALQWGAVGVCPTVRVRAVGVCPPLATLALADGFAVGSLYVGPLPRRVCCRVPPAPPHVPAVCWVEVWLIAPGAGAVLAQFRRSTLPCSLDVVARAWVPPCDAAAAVS